MHGLFNTRYDFLAVLLTILGPKFHWANLILPLVNPRYRRGKLHLGRIDMPGAIWNSSRNDGDKDLPQYLWAKAKKQE